MSNGWPTPVNLKERTRIESEWPTTVNLKPKQEKEEHDASAIIVVPLECHLVNIA